MLTASRALSRAASLGEPLPHIPALAQLYERGVEIRRSELTMIAGMSGSQKSGLALWLTMQWNLPTIWVCADMPQHMAVTRMAAAATGSTTTTVEQGMKAGAEGFYAEALDEFPFHWSFDPVPSVPDLGLELDAYVECWDRYPSVIVIDNLVNIETDHEAEHQGQKWILSELLSLARETGAAVIVLHHMKEDQRDTSKPAPKRDLMNRVSALPELILSVALDTTSGEFRYTPVKCNGGWSKSDASEWFSLRCRPEKATFEPWTNIGYGYQGWGQDE